MTSLYENLKQRQLNARKIQNTLASDLYGLILGEAQTKDNFSNEFILTFVQKLLKSNEECLAKRDDSKLRRQSDLLKDLVPLLTVDDIKRVASGLELPEHKGKATGELMKALRKEGYAPDPAVIKEFLDARV